MLQKYFDIIIYNTGNWSISVGNLVFLILVLSILIWGFYKTKSQLLPYLYKRYKYLQQDTGQINKTLIQLFIISAISLTVEFANLNVILIENNHILLSFTTILMILTIYLLVKLAKWIFIDIIHNHYFSKKKKRSGQKEIELKTKRVIAKVIQYIIYTLALLWSFHVLQFDLSYSFSVDKKGDSLIRFISLTKILGGVLIILSMRLLVWMINELILRAIYEKKEIDYSNQFALNQLIKYFIYVITIFITLEYLGLDLTIMWGSAAALLVGIGLGLQDIFKDFISGIALLFERSIGVGDVLEINNEVGIIREIGIRASLVETNDKVTVVVPNSQLVNIAVNNWTNLDQLIRLQIDVGVAYGSDVDLVKKLLLEAALQDEQCVKDPGPLVLFGNFGESSLEFQLLFFIKDFLMYRQIKSRIRFNINQIFLQNNIKIPFPQRDVHLFPK